MAKGPHPWEQLGGVEFTGRTFNALPVSQCQDSTLYWAFVSVLLPQPGEGTCIFSPFAANTSPSLEMMLDQVSLPQTSRPCCSSWIA